MAKTITELFLKVNGELVPYIYNFDRNSINNRLNNIESTLASIDGVGDLLDVQFVTLDTDQTIIGKKNLNDITYLVLDDTALNSKNSMVEKDVTPTSTTYYSINFKDKDNNRVGYIQESLKTDGTNTIDLTLGEWNGQEAATIQLVQDYTNNKNYVVIPGLIDYSDNSNKVPTTTWVRNATGDTNLKSASSYRADADADGNNIIDTYATKEELEDSIGNFVTIDTEQTITGRKTFSDFIISNDFAHDISLGFQINTIKGNKIDGNAYKGIGVYDTSGFSSKNLFSSVLTQVNNSYSQLLLRSYNNIADNNRDLAELAIVNDIANNIKYIKGITPVLEDSSNKIPTTQWVRTATGNTTLNAATADVATTALNCSGNAEEASAINSYFRVYNGLNTIPYWCKILEYDYSNITQKLVDSYQFIFNSVTYNTLSSYGLLKVHFRINWSEANGVSLTPNKCWLIWQYRVNIDPDCVKMVHDQNNKKVYVYLKITGSSYVEYKGTLVTHGSSDIDHNTAWEHISFCNYSIPDSNAVEEIPEEYTLVTIGEDRIGYVTLDTEQNINVKKQFNSLYITSNDNVNSNIVFCKPNPFAWDTVPSRNSFCMFNFYDKDENRLAYIQQAWRSNGYSAIDISTGSKDPESDAYLGTGLTIARLINSTGEGYVSISKGTPPLGDSTNKVPTTSWIRNATGNTNLTAARALADGSGNSFSNFVTINTEQKITGKKIFKGENVFEQDINIQKVNPYINFYQSSVEKGINPSSNRWVIFTLGDKNRAGLGGYYYVTRTSGNQEIILQINPFVPEGTETTLTSAQLKLSMTKAGGKYVSFPTYTDPTCTTAIGVTYEGLRAATGDTLLTAAKAKADENGTSIKTGYVNVANEQTITGKKTFKEIVIQPGWDGCTTVLPFARADGSTSTKYVTWDLYDNAGTATVNMLGNLTWRYYANRTSQATFTISQPGDSTEARVCLGLYIFLSADGTKDYMKGITYTFNTGCNDNTLVTYAGLRVATGNTSLTAAKATADGAGNNIVNTYATKTSVPNITYGTATVSSSLATGAIYLQYEA